MNLKLKGLTNPNLRNTAPDINHKHRTTKKGNDWGNSPGTWALQGAKKNEALKFFIRSLFDVTKLGPLVGWRKLNILSVCFTSLVISQFIPLANH